jgi:hypothetical protein
MGVKIFNIGEISKLSWGKNIDNLFPSVVERKKVTENNILPSDLKRGVYIKDRVTN